MKFSTLAVATLAFFSPVAAHATTVVSVNGVCVNGGSATQAACTSTNGTYGNSNQLTLVNDSTLQVKLTAWQANQTNGAITSAFLGAYGGGFGVTGVQDQNGGGELHQMDNVNGYTDFIMLQFSRAVRLDTATMNLYQLSGVTGKDSDASTFDAGFLKPSTWNASINLASGQYSNDPNKWANTSVGTSSNGSRALNATSNFSQVWLVSASMLTTDRNDGFKLSQIIVTPQVIATPEPATWAMMIIGFGGIGATLRRRRSAGAPQHA